MSDQRPNGGAADDHTNDDDDDHGGGGGHTSISFVLLGHPIGLGPPSQRTPSSQYQPGVPAFRPFFLLRPSAPESISTIGPSSQQLDQEHGVTTTAPYASNEALPAQDNNNEDQQPQPQQPDGENRNQNDRRDGQEEQEQPQGFTVNFSFDFTDEPATDTSDAAATAPSQPPPRTNSRYNLRPRPMPSGLPPTPLNVDDNDGDNNSNNDNNNTHPNRREQRVWEQNLRDMVLHMFAPHAARLAETVMMQMMNAAGGGGMDAHRQGQPPASEAARTKLMSMSRLSPEQAAKCPSCVICQDAFPVMEGTEFAGSGQGSSAETSSSTNTETNNNNVSAENIAMRQMPCKHIFHENCLFRWLEQSNQCPTCRYEIMTENSEYNASVAHRMSDRDSQIALDEAAELAALKAKADAVKAMDGKAGADDAVPVTRATRPKTFHHQQHSRHQEAHDDEAKGRKRRRRNRSVSVDNAAAPAPLMSSAPASSSHKRRRTRKC